MIYVSLQEKNEGIKLSEGLIENHVPISSSETLLKNATEILVLIEIKKNLFKPQINSM